MEICTPKVSKNALHINNCGRVEEIRLNRGRRWTETLSQESLSQSMGSSGVGMIFKVVLPEGPDIYSPKENRHWMQAGPKEEKWLWRKQLCWLRAIWGLSCGRFQQPLFSMYCSTLAWKLPWMEEPGRLQSMGSLRIGHDSATWLSLFTFMHWRRKWQPTPVFLLGESQGQESLVGCRLWDRTESDRTEVT